MYFTKGNAYGSTRSLILLLRELDINSAGELRTTDLTQFIERVRRGSCDLTYEPYLIAQAGYVINES